MTTGTRAPASARDIFERAIDHHLGGRNDAAIAAYRDALAVDATLAPALNNLGALLGSNGRRDEALTLFRDAVQLDPTYGEARNNLGIALAHSGKHEEAIPQFEAA